MNLNDTEVLAAVDRAKTALEIANAFKVDSPELYEMAGRELMEIKAQRKRLDDLRKTMTKPLDESKKAIMDFFRQPLDWLDNAEEGIKRGMLTFKQEQDRLEREAREQAAAEARRIAAEAAKRNPDALPPVIIAAPPAVQVAPKISGISTREVWKCEVTDPTIIPREYLVVDTAKLNAMARATRGTVSVPGVRFYAEEVMSAKSE